MGPRPTSIAQNAHGCPSDTRRHPEARASLAAHCCRVSRPPVSTASWNMPINSSRAARYAASCVCPMATCHRTFATPPHSSCFPAWLRLKRGTPTVTLPSPISAFRNRGRYCAAVSALTLHHCPSRSSIAFFQIGCVWSRSFTSRVLSHTRRIWLSAVMASATCRLRCWSVRRVPLAVDAIVVCPVSVELSDLDLGCDVVGGWVLCGVFAPCVGLWFGDAGDHVPD